MIRKLILTAALATATLTGLAATSGNADATPPVGHNRPEHFGRFEVLVRRHGCWEKYGTYRDRDDARRAARALRHRGLEVKVDRC